MRPPKYPLQTVLDQRGREKEDAKKAFAQSIKNLESQQQRLKDLEAEKVALAKTKEEMIQRLYDPEPDGTIQLTTVERRRDGVKYMDVRMEEKGREIVAQQNTVREAEENVEKMKALLLEADKAVKAIEKHQENWLAEWKKEMAQKEQRVGEEITLARFVRDAAEAAEENE